MKKIFALLTLSLAGCSTGIVSTDKDAYMVATTSMWPPLPLWVSTASNQKANVYQEASDFCGDAKKNVETLDLRLWEARIYRAAKAELNFRCIDNNAAK